MRRRLVLVTGLALVAALPAATSSASEIRKGTFPSQSLGTDVAYVVQLPPGYADSQRDYPVVYVLHGLFESPDFWVGRGLAAMLDDAWASGALPPFVVAAVDGGNSFFINGPAGAFQDLVTRDFLGFVESQFRVRPRRESRALLGVSMGGYGALRIAFEQPQLFAAVATHSAMLLESIPTAAAGAGSWQMAAFHRAFGDPIDPALWHAADPLALARTAPVAGLPALYFDCGASDRYGLEVGTRALHVLLEKRGVSHEFALPPGDHGYTFVRSRLLTSLAFLTQHLDTDLPPDGGVRKESP